MGIICDHQINDTTYFYYETYTPIHLYFCWVKKSKVYMVSEMPENIHNHKLFLSIKDLLIYCVSMMTSVVTPLIDFLIKCHVEIRDVDFRHTEFSVVMKNWESKINDVLEEFPKETPSGSKILESDGTSDLGSFSLFREKNVKSIDTEIKSKTKHIINAISQIIIESKFLTAMICSSEYFCIVSNLRLLLLPYCDLCYMKLLEDVMNIHSGDDSLFESELISDSDSDSDSDDRLEI